VVVVDRAPLLHSRRQQGTRRFGTSAKDSGEGKKPPTGTAGGLQATKPSGTAVTVTQKVLLLLLLFSWRASGSGVGVDVAGWLAGWLG
jgi:hypothetical protein